MNIVPVPILILLQFIPFFVTMIGLYFIIFKPMLSYLDARDDSTVGAREKGEKLSNEVDQKMAELADQLRTAQNKIGEQRGQSRAEATERYNAIVNEARDEANAEVKRAVDEIQAQQEEARVALKGEAEAIAQQIASSALGRDIKMGVA